jgi:hypothetical protein
VVTKDVTIVIRERGAKATSGSIKRIGSTSAKATLAVGALLTALGGFAAIRGLARLSKDAIAASASFEQFGIRIGALLGSQKEANIALDNFTQLASKTPFAVSEIVEGASALGAAALGNRGALEELTQTAANLAAVTGLSFRDAAGNLQRALSAGIGAADLFRERGVRALIESIKGIPDATKLTKTELDAAFKDVFGAGGIFGKAAEELSNTLGGALSNIGDAATNTKVALGNAFAPAVIAAARQAIIPFLANLQKLIEDNEGNLRELAATVIQKVVGGLIGMVRAGAAVIQTFRSITQFVRTAVGAFKQSALNLADTRQQFLELGGSLGLVSVEKVLEGRAALQALREEVDAYALKNAEAEAANEAFNATLDAGNEKLAELERSIEGIDFNRPTGPSRPDIDLGNIGGGDPGQTEEQLSALEKIRKLTDQLRISSAARVSQEEAQIERLVQQRRELLLQAEIAGDLEAAREGLLEIDAQIADIREKQKEDAFEGITGEEVAKRVGDAVGNSVGSAMRGAIAGEGIDAMGILADIGGSLVEDALNDAIDTIKTAVTDVFSGIAESLGSSSGLGGAFGSAIAGAIGVGIGILAQELGGTSASARNDLVRSATESSQATRGVVAGPTSIPVFQVGQQLEEAMGTTNGILNDILAAILGTSGGGGGGGQGGPAATASADLSLTSPSLI